MGTTTVREPQQKRSIEKKGKIIKAGISLICSNGYFNTTTADIAKAANVSTGIIYSYFRDKRDILIAGLSILSEDMIVPILEAVSILNNSKSLEENLDYLLDYFVDIHVKMFKPHQELAYLILEDPELACFGKDFEAKISEKLAASLKQQGYPDHNLLEKTHIAYNLVETYAHEVAFHKHGVLDCTVLKKETINCIIALFLKQIE